MNAKTDLEKNRKVYQALGLADCVGIDEVKKAYRELALLHHPDKNPGDPSAAERFKEVSCAYQVLSNPERKKSYDASLATFVRSPSGLRFGETTKSSLQEELNQFRQARRAREPPHTPTKTYTKEQTDQFKQREKERELEMRRRLEKEREARREAEAERSRRLKVEKEREEERRRQRQEKLTRDKIDRVFDDRPRAGSFTARTSSFTATSSGNFTPRTPPPPATAGEAQAKDGDDAGDAFGPTVSSPVYQDDSTSHQKQHLERQRRERERQEEVRRKEHERYLEKRLQEVRQKEEEKQRQRESEHSQQTNRQMELLIAEEQQERNFSISPEENHSRLLIMTSLRSIEAAYYLAIAVERLGNMERSDRQHLATLELMGRSLLRFEGQESSSRAMVYREFRHTVERLDVSRRRDITRIDGNIHARNRMENLEQEARWEFVQNPFECERDQLTLVFAEGKIRDFLVKTQRRELTALQNDAFNAVRRMTIDDEMIAIREKLVELEWASRENLSLEMMEGTRRAGLLLDELEATTVLLRRRATALQLVYRASELKMQQQVAELQKARTTDREEKNKLVVEVSRLNQQLSSAKGDNEILQTSARLSRRITKDASAQCDDIHETSSPSRHKQWITPTTPKPESEDDPDVEAKDKEIAELRRKVEQLEKAKDSRELVSLLCSENKRLLEANAKLTEENRRISLTPRAEDARSPQSVTTPPQLSNYHSSSPLGGSPAQWSDRRKAWGSPLTPNTNTAGGPGKGSLEPTVGRREFTPLR